MHTFFSFFSFFHFLRADFSVFGTFIHYLFSLPPFCTNCGADAVLNLDGVYYFTHELLHTWWAFYAGNKVTYKGYWMLYVSRMLEWKAVHPRVQKNKNQLEGLYFRVFQQACINYVLLQRIDYSAMVVRARTRPPISDNENCPVNLSHLYHMLKTYCLYLLLAIWLRSANAKVRSR
jgi:hypothetical protein